MRPKIYFTVHDWMFKALKLRGNQLIIFSYLYAESKYGAKDGYSTINSISEVLNIPDRTVRHCTLELREKNYITGKLVKTKNYTK